MASALGSGPRGRGFKSHHPDKFRATMKRSIALLTLSMLLVGASAPASAASSTEQTPKIDVFVTSWCPYCRRLEGFLKKNHIDYTRYDVEQDVKGAEEFDRLGGEGVPLTRVGKEIIHGYDPERIIAALQTNKS